MSKFAFSVLFYLALLATSQQQLKTLMRFTVSC